MHRPPAVSWEAGPARRQGRLLAALALCATMVWTGFWVLQGWGTSSFILLLVLSASILLAVRAGKSAPVGQLGWDGEQWHWTGAGAGAVPAIACVLDLQGMLLLRILCESGTRHWLWLEAGAQPARWKAMRRALVAATSNAGIETGPTQQA